MGTGMQVHEQEQYGVVQVRERTAVYQERLDRRTQLYLEQLRAFDARCGSPDADREELLAAITIENESMLAACAEFERAVGHDAEALQSARERFRDQTHAMLSKSHFITQARTWPRGYQGDYQMLEGVYRNIPLATGIGYYLDRYSLSTSLGVAVRERRATLRGLLSRELERRSKPAVLDIACGSCREVFELAQDIAHAGATFTCLDFDPEALQFAANRMPYSGIDPDQVVFRQYNALKMINAQRNLKEFGRQDVIYSVGFFDYLADDVLVRLLASLYELLSPGGLLITSFKDRDRYGSQYYHWMVDWDGFLQRTDEESRDLLRQAGIPDGAVTTLRDASQVIIFYNASK
jgi:SAM-dependent methyltransferase